MPDTVDALLRMTIAQLDHLFGVSPAGSIPEGYGEGTVITGPDAAFNRRLAKFAATCLWQGKFFDAEHGTLANVVAGCRVITADVYSSLSLYDDNPCILLDYSKNSLIANHLRDEIRLLEPGFYLGKAYWNSRPWIHFCLQFAG